VHPHHFVERRGLIAMIAIGASLIRLLTHRERRGAHRGCATSTRIPIPMVVGITRRFAMKDTLAQLGDEPGTIQALVACGCPAL
jgi:hypothetical protein